MHDKASGAGNRRPQVRIGIATGLVAIGNLHGEIASKVLDVPGDTPNLAARLQGIARPDSIVVASDARKQVGDLFEWAISSRCGSRDCSTKSAPGR